MESLAGAMEAEGSAEEAWYLEYNALEIARGLHRARRLLWVALGNLGYTCISRAIYDDAVRYLEEVLVLARDLDEGSVVGASRCNIAVALIHLGRIDAAGRYAAEATICAIESSDQILGAACLEVLAAVEIERGNLRFVARLLGASEALRDKLGYELEPAERALHDRMLEIMRSERTDSELTNAWAAGASMDLEEAFALIGREYLQ